jgi:hypothetical protein
MSLAARSLTPVFRTALFTFVALSLSAPLAQPKSHAKLILGVITRHFTVGRRIRSVYLRVYSDGSAECHTFRFTGDETKKIDRKTLAREELQSLEAALGDPALLHVGKKYVPWGPVIDSWMEWEINVPHGWQTRQIDIKVDDFALEIEAFDITPEAERQKLGSYPPALLKLGCLSWKVRNEVYGDETFQGKPLYLTDGCKGVLRNQ